MCKSSAKKEERHGSHRPGASPGPRHCTPRPQNCTPDPDSAHQDPDSAPQEPTLHLQAPALHCRTPALSPRTLILYPQTPTVHTRTLTLHPQTLTLHPQDPDSAPWEAGWADTPQSPLSPPQGHPTCTPGSSRPQGVVHLQARELLRNPQKGPCVTHEERGGSLLGRKIRPGCAHQLRFSGEARGPEQRDATTLGGQPSWAPPVPVPGILGGRHGPFPRERRSCQLRTRPPPRQRPHMQGHGPPSEPRPPTSGGVPASLRTASEGGGLQWVPGGRAARRRGYERERPPWAPEAGAARLPVSCSREPSPLQAPCPQHHSPGTPAAP